MMKTHEGSVINIRITEHRVENTIVRLIDEITSELDKDKIAVETIRFHLDMIEFWQDTIRDAKYKQTPLYCGYVECDYDE